MGIGIGVDLAGLLRGRMASAKGGSVPSGVRYGEGCPLSSRIKGLGERRELPQRGPGQSPGRKRILAYFEGPRTLIFVPIWQNLGGGTICISAPAPNSGGTCPPPAPPPWSTPMHAALYSQPTCSTSSADIFWLNATSRPRRYAIEMYASAAKLASTSLLTSKLFGFNFVIHFTPIMCYTS